MGDFATTAELAEFAGDAELDSPRGELLVQLAEGSVRNYTRQTLSFVEDDTVELRGGSLRLVLPERPVIDVTQVFIDGDEVTHFRLVRDVLYRGVMRSYWGTAENLITVTYSHGFLNIPDEIKAVVLQIATRARANPRSVTSESIGDWSATWSGSGAGGGAAPTHAERSILDRFRYEQAATR